MQVDANSLLTKYGEELAVMTRRALIAETAYEQAQAQIAALTADTDEVAAGD